MTNVRSHFLLKLLNNFKFLLRIFILTAEHASTSGWTLSGRHIVTVADRDNISALGDEVYDNTENLHYLVWMLLRPLAPIEIRLEAWQQAAILRHNMLHNVQAKRTEVTAICRAVEPSVGDKET